MSANKASDSTATQDLIDLFNAYQIASQSALRTHGQLEQVDILSHAPDGTSLAGHWLSMILLCGADFRILFSVYFDSEPVHLICTENLKLSADRCRESVYLDFMRELCNQTSGLVKQDFDRLSIIAGLSLPMIARGFDALMHRSRTHAPFRHKHTWCLAFSQHSIVCEVEVETTNFEQFTALKDLAPKAEDDIEFL